MHLLPDYCVLYHGKHRQKQVIFLSQTNVLSGKLTLTLELSDDGVQESVLRRDVSASHRHPRARSRLSPAESLELKLTFPPRARHARLHSATRERWRTSWDPHERIYERTSSREPASTRLTVSSFHACVRGPLRVVRPQKIRRPVKWRQTNLLRDIWGAGLCGLWRSREVPQFYNSPVKSFFALILRRIKYL